MSAYQRLDMRQSQSLVMTPQLQQAIKLLQLSNIELAEFVAEEIERNPLLERGETAAQADLDSQDDKSKGRDELSLDGSDGIGTARDAVDASDSDMYEAGTGSDEARTANSQSGPSASTDWSTVGSGRGGSDDFDFEGSLTSEKTLHQHLHDQLAMAGLSQADSLIGARLIDETDDAGFCKIDLDEVATALGADPANVAAVLTVCQGFDPTGVMARDLTECLALQLKERNRLDPAMMAFLENLHLVAKHDFKALSEVCGVDKEDIMDMLTELRSLSPRPASGFASEATIAVAPDVFVREMPNGMFAVELNSETLPRVLMDKAYYSEVSALPMRDKEKEFISECAANATWLIKSLDQRARTILKVASEIVRQQDAFFAHGVAHLRPLNLKQVADAIEMHESTVSRVTSNKYMATPRGLYLLPMVWKPSACAASGFPNLWGCSRGLSGFCRSRKCSHFRRPRIGPNKGGPNSCCCHVSQPGLTAGMSRPSWRMWH